MKLKRILAAAMAAAMGLSMLTACGNDSSDSSNASSGEDAGTLNVKIWDSTQLEGIRQICEEWSAESGVDVQVEVVNWDNYWTLLEAGASGGQMPDVFWMHSNNAQRYMDAELLLNLNDYIAADESIDMDNYYQDIVELYTQDDGTYYAIPKDYDTIALWYNKDMFDAAGIEYPTNDWTWDDLYEAGKALTKDGKYGMAMDTDLNQEGYYNIIYSYGGYVINDAKDESGWDDPKTVEAMEMWGKIVKDCMPAQSMMSESGEIDMFTSQVTAMQLMGSWRVAALQEYDCNWGVVNIPYYDANSNGQCDAGERVSIYNGLGWAASAATKNPDAAYSLISYLCSEKGQTEQAELGVTMSAYMGTSDAWVDARADLWDLSPYLNVTEGSDRLVIYPYSRATIWAENAKQELVPAYNDPSTMADTLKTMAASMEAELEAEKK
ncbi:ABC transporter substrate-binding protein [Agathobaculum sp. LCP25S3_E8]|uniref:ABC transporter substrate-binding protein n=1 Tax=Agathobaculum sp. LCP25S3_E8 TaxID=3438735 RepID=UPI003F8EB26D